MRRLSASILLVALALVAGCAGTSATLQSDYKLAANERLALNLVTPTNASEEGMAILRERLTTQLSSSGLLASASDPQARTVEVVVTNYYMRHGAARALVGIMAGVDNIQSTIKLKDKASDKVLWEFKVQSENPSAWGTSRGMIQDHADEIVSTLRGVKR